MHAVDSVNTCWVFISDSTEGRHVYDVVHAVNVLRQKGVPKNSIRFFTDDHQAFQFTNEYDCPAPLPIPDLGKELASINGFKYLFVTITGHGGIDGIGHPVKLTASSVLAAARGAPGIELAVLAIAQCFAGTFNYMNARAEPAVVMFGAANLSTSLSTPIRLGQPIQGLTVPLQQWSANTFMFYLFRWILKPRDIDGDGACTLLDAYKYSGSSASNEIIKVKPALFMETQRLADENRQLAYDILMGVAKNDASSKLRMEALRTALRQKVGLLHTSQEPWLLHADLARKLVFS
ncbi:hypothetical protein [Pseudomonas coronafaciens]|uniref:hypothetical protein n=1 Tax=Pseudomonas coronafaciens TaxID=53409 RepID=UPI0006D62776|nr:hypothetical protein [Pseudomonas coronafaciens]KPW28763.1 Uncharacterized protein ALO66_01840 [Pseudomonas coronafaciens pv. atropurpurea]